jgi:hypothetical protein
MGDDEIDQWHKITKKLGTPPPAMLQRCSRRVRAVCNLSVTPGNIARIRKAEWSYRIQISIQSLLVLRSRCCAV